MRNSFGEKPAVTVRAQSEGSSTPTSYQTISVFDRRQMELLEAQLPKIDPRCADAIPAGIALGVQLVLAKLREGFVSG